MADKKPRGWRRVIPPLPSFRSNLGLGLPSAGRTLSESIDAGVPTCPYDGTAMTLADVFDQDREGKIVGDAQRGFVCPECGAVMPVENLIADLRANVDSMRRAERDYFLFALAMILAFGGLWLFTGYMMTLVGGLVFALVLMLLSLTYRYRAWQGETGNLFRREAPVREWIRHELSKK